MSDQELHATIAELRRQLQAAEQNNRDLLSFQAAADIGMIFLDRSLHVLHYTPRMQELFSLTPAALQQPLADIAHRLSYAELIADASRVLADDAPVEHEVQDGDECWYIARLLPYHGTDKQLNGLVITFVDISARKQAEEYWRASEERLRLLNENVHDYAIMMFNLEGRFIDWNAGAERMFGYTPEEIQGQPGERIFTPEDNANGVPAREMHMAARDGRAEDERWHMRKDGSRFWVSGVMSALRDEQRTLRGFAKVARDMTVQRQAEALLREREARLRMALNAAQMGTWDWDISQNALLINEGSHHILGKDLSAAPITFAQTQKYIHPDDHVPVWRALERSLAAHTPFSYEFRVIWDDGSLHWLASEAQASYDQTGAPVRVIGVITEITDRKAAEAAILRSHDELEWLVQARTAELAAANSALQIEIAERTHAQAARSRAALQLVTAEEDERRRISREMHDQFGQKITAMLLSMQQLKAMLDPPGPAFALLDELQHKVDQFGHDIHQLALQLRPTSLDDLGLSAALASYVQDWMQRTQVHTAFHSRGLDTNRASPLVETTIYRVVLEALNNIARHAQARHVSVILERQDGHVLAIVEDDGRGFDAEQVLARQQQDGRLGLLGMQERVAQVNGKLTIESTPDNGTTIIIRILLSADMETE